MSGDQLTPKQESFCRHYIETGCASEAYRKAYSAENMKPEAIHVEASKLFTNPKVALRISELQAELAERHEITVDALVGELDEARLKAMADDKGASAAVSAVLGKAKLLGFLTDKHEHTAEIKTTSEPADPRDLARAVLAIFNSAKLEES